MTEFIKKTFTVYPGKDGGETYRDNWDRVFAKSTRCQERDSNGIQCELDNGHESAHACPEALARYSK